MPPRGYKLKTPMALSAEVMNAEPALIKKPKPECSWVIVSPDLAMKWLDEHNTNNRTVRDGHVARLASDMKEGRWRGQNGEAIRFDTENRLVDGQHRLWACVIAETPFETLLIRKCDPADYSTIGVGAKKQLSDFLGPVHGEKNVHLLAAVIRLVYAWQNGGLSRLKDSKAYPSISQLEITLRDHPNIRDSVNVVSGMNHVRKILTASYASLIHYAGTLQNKSATVHSFLDRLGSGLGLEATDPVYQLRQFLLAQVSPSPGHRRTGKEYVLALTIKAWNLSKSAQPVRRLKFAVDEEFPVL